MSGSHAIYYRYYDRFFGASYSRMPGSIEPATVAVKLMKSIRQQVDLTDVKIMHTLNRSPEEKKGALLSYQVGY